MRKHLPKGRPSPALIVSFLALLVGLSGTAVAASQINGNNLKPRSVGGGKLKPFTGGLVKPGSIHGSKLKPFTGGLIKSQSIPAGKIQPDSLGGDQIDESKLGPVPTAERLAGSYQAKVAFGESVDLAKIGPFTFTGQCLQNGTTDDGTEGRDIARIVIASTEAGAVFTSGVDSLTGGAPEQFLTPETPEADRVVSEISTETGTAGYKTSGRFSALAADGTGVNLASGDNSAALNLFDTGCTFQGSARVTS